VREPRSLWAADVRFCRYRFKFKATWFGIYKTSNFAFNLAKQNKLKIHNKGTVDLYPNPTAPCILTRR
jgi:hypothetical protein